MDVSGPSPRVLIVEDDAQLQHVLSRLLGGAGYRLDFARRGHEGLERALLDPPDLLLLDLGLPDMDGTSLCCELRKRSDRRIPVLMLTARDALAEKLEGFASGADDYLAKPFAGEELLARCAALMLRKGLGQTHCQRIGRLTVDRLRHQAFIDDRPLALAPLPYRILRELAEAHPRALTRSELVDRLWGDEAPPSDPLRTHLTALRQALAAVGTDGLIRTVQGVGYRLDDGS